MCLDGVSIEYRLMNGSIARDSASDAHPLAEELFHLAQKLRRYRPLRYSNCLREAYDAARFLRCGGRRERLLDPLASRLSGTRGFHGTTMTGTLAAE